MDQETQVILETFRPGADLVLVSKGYVTTIPFSAIIRVAKKGFYLQVFTRGESYTCMQSMEEMLRELPPQQFARVHKSHIISLQHVHLLGSTVPFTPYYKSQLIRQLARQLEQGYQHLYEPV